MKHAQLLMTRAHECEREIMDIFPDAWFFSVRNHLARSVITLHDDNLHWALHTRASFVTLKHFHVTREPKSNLKFWIFSSVSRLSAFLFLCCIVRGMSRLKKILWVIYAKSTSRSSGGLYRMCKFQCICTCMMNVVSVLSSISCYQKRGKRRRFSVYICVR